MKLLLIFAAILAFSLAEEEKKNEQIEDSEAEASASVELLKSGSDLNTAASSYNTYIPPSQRPPQWNLPNYVQPSVPPQNNWLPPQEPVKPIQPIHTGVPSNVQNDYYDHHHHHRPQWTTPVYQPPSTTPVAVIKNEQIYGDNGYYKYEYQLSDGTHVGEEGYYTNPKQTDESLVKKGWYSYAGADGKKYTVTYWADHTGYHAYGDHLPTPPPVPAAIQASLDKENEADKYKPLQDYPSQTPAPTVYPTQAPNYNYFTKPTYVTFQPTYKPPVQPTYKPPQQPSYNPQQFYYPPQQTYPSQQSYPSQQYYPQQYNNYA